MHSLMHICFLYIDICAIQHKHMFRYIFMADYYVNLLMYCENYQL